MADVPARRRAAWIAGSAAAVVAAGLVVLWVVPVLLTRHPSEGLTAVQRLTAVNDVRGTLVTFLVAVGAAGTLIFTGRTFLLSRETQVTERYTRAVSQIGDASLEVRIGGIYALERIGRDSAADRPAVVYIMGALVRNRSRDGRAPGEEPPEDVYAALRVVSRLAPATSVIVNLRGADLRNANLRFMRDTKVNIDDADLTGATAPQSWMVPAGPPPGQPEEILTSQAAVTAGPAKE